MNSLNGKKSYVGIVGYILTDLAVNNAWISLAAGETLTPFFLGLAGVGVIHKLGKLEKK